MILHLHVVIAPHDMYSSGASKAVRCGGARALSPCPYPCELPLQCTRCSRSMWGAQTIAMSLTGGVPQSSSGPQMAWIIARPWFGRSRSRRCRT